MRYYDIENQIKKAKKIINYSSLRVFDNIYDYNNKLFRLKKFKCALNRYIDLLSSDGKILITYLHDIKRDNNLEKFERKNLIDNYYLKKIENKSGRCDSALYIKRKSN